MPLARSPPGASSWDWRELWIDPLNRLIARPRFQAWAARSPLTRWIARRRARQIFDLCAGFVYSQVLLACVRLRIFELLAEGPLDLATISERIGLSGDATRRLLRAASSLRLTRTLPNERYGLDELGAAIKGNPSIALLVEHHGLLYQDLADPVALLRGEAATKLSGFWPYSDNAPGAAGLEAGSERAYSEYSALMAGTQPLVAEDILDAYRIERHRALLDVGGGEGVFASAAVARAPQLKARVFDLPPVVARARARLDRTAAGRGIETAPGDFLRDPLPAGADVISLVRVLHDHDDESCAFLLRSAREALPSGGVLLVAEPMSGIGGAEPIGDAYFGFYLLAMGRGRPRTQGELARLLESAGFADVRPLRTRRPMLVSALIGRRL